jgi:Na+/melibiose symporter-like transporter
MLLLLMAVLVLNLRPSIYVLYGFATALGIAKLVLDLSYTSLLPELIEGEHLVTGNARLQVTGAGIKVLAPALAGLLAKYFFPPLILLVSFFAFVVSATALLFLPASTRQLRDVKPPDKFFHEMLIGLKMLYENELLRPLVTSSCVSAFAMGIYQALLVISMTRILSLDTSSLGFLVAMGGVATLFGASIVPTVTRFIGMGRTLVVGNVFTTAGFMSIAGGVQDLSVPLASIGLLLIGFGSPLFSVNQISVRQAVTPIELMARVNAGRRFIVFSFLPIGAIFGGVVGEKFSIAAGLLCATVAMGVATIILICCGFRHRYLHFERSLPRN